VSGRVANFLAHYPVPGGTTHAVRGISRALLRLGWDAIIYCYAQPGFATANDAADGIGIVRFGTRSRTNPFHADRNFLDRLSRNQDRIDLLVLHGMFSPGNLIVGKVATEAGIPYIVCPHDPYHPELLKKGRWRKLLYGVLFERPFLNASSGIHLLSETHRKFLSDYGVHRPAFVVPNGFDPQEFAAAESNPVREPICSHGDPVFLYLGRLDMHHKGLDLLLKGFAAALEQSKLPTTTVLDLVGSDWGDQARLESLVSQLGINYNVRFLGRIADRTSAAIIAAYDLLVLPSRFDGFGLAALEAMVVGKPMLVSEEAGIAALAQQAQCGYTVKPEVESICAGLAHAFQTRSHWVSMGERGRRFAYQHLTWENSAEQAIREYEIILGRAAASCDNLCQSAQTSGTPSR
jgi:glycosyltransferase involved in cell wall biosynthesis